MKIYFCGYYHNWNDSFATEVHRYVASDHKPGKSRVSIFKKIHGTIKASYNKVLQYGCSVNLGDKYSQSQNAILW